MQCNPIIHIRLHKIAVSLLRITIIIIIITIIAICISPYRLETTFLPSLS